MLGVENNLGTNWRILFAFGGLLDLVPILAWTFRLFILMWHKGLLSGTICYSLQSYYLPVKGI